MLAHLPAGAVTFLAGAFVLYALRGPFVELPRSPLGVLVVLVAIFALGCLMRLAALALAWGIAQLWPADVFQEHAPLELVDELSPRRLGPELLERVASSVRSSLGVELPRIARGDDEGARDAKARAFDEVFALARAKAGALAPSRTTLLEGRVEGARSLAAALFLSAVLVLLVALHDVLFAHEIAHAFSSFSIVTCGLGLLFATIAAIGWARAQARAFALFVLLLPATESRKPA